MAKLLFKFQWKFFKFCANILEFFFDLIWSHLLTAVKLCLKNWSTNIWQKYETNWFQVWIGWHFQVFISVLEIIEKKGTHQWKTTIRMAWYRVCHSIWSEWKINAEESLSSEQKYFTRNEFIYRIKLVCCFFGLEKIIKKT